MHVFTQVLRYCTKTVTEFTASETHHKVHQSWRPRFRRGMGLGGILSIKGTLGKISRARRFDETPATSSYGELAIHQTVLCWFQGNMEFAMEHGRHIHEEENWDNVLSCIEILKQYSSGIVTHVQRFCLFSLLCLFLRRSSLGTVPVWCDRRNTIHYKTANFITTEGEGIKPEYSPIQVQQSTASAKRVF